MAVLTFDVIYLIMITFIKMHFNSHSKQGPLSNLALVSKEWAKVANSDVMKNELVKFHQTALWMLKKAKKIDWEKHRVFMETVADNMKYYHYLTLVRRSLEIDPLKFLFAHCPAQQNFSSEEVKIEADKYIQFCFLDKVFGDEFCDCAEWYRLRLKERNPDESTRRIPLDTKVTKNLYPALGLYLEHTSCHDLQCSSSLLESFNVRTLSRLLLAEMYLKYDHAGLRSVLLRELSYFCKKRKVNRVAETCHILDSFVHRDGLSLFRMLVLPVVQLAYLSQNHQALLLFGVLLTPKIKEGMKKEDIMTIGIDGKDIIYVDLVKFELTKEVAKTIATQRVIPTSSDRCNDLLKYWDLDSDEIGRSLAGLLRHSDSDLSPENITYLKTLQQIIEQ